MSGSDVKTLFASIFSLALFLGATSSAPAQGIPGGATSLNETHGDWTVSCTAPEGVVRCTITQMQVQGENRQRVLAIELTRASDGNGVTGMLVLPFGLRLDDGITLALDEADPIQKPRFSTCLPAGCLVPLTFGSDLVTALGGTASLAIKAVANDSGEDVALAVSLKGFSSALARLGQLTTP